MEQRSSGCPLLERGQLSLSIRIAQEILLVYVYGASHLKHPKLNAGPCSIFVKVSLIPKDDSSIIRQTKEVVGNVSPMFDEVFTYQILSGDSKKRLWITVCWKDSSNEQTDLIGCMSFGMERLLAKTQKEAVEGWFCLLSESVGRGKHIRTPETNVFDEVQLNLFMMPVMIVMQRHPTGFGFTLMGSSPVCVVKVKRDSSAATAGLALGDYITNVNGQDVSRLSAESVAAIIRSIEKILILDIYRYPAFEQDENHPVHVETFDSYRDPTLLWNKGAKKTSSKYVDTDSWMIKRSRVNLMRSFRSKGKSTVEVDYNIFFRQEYQVEEAIYAEIDESLPVAPPLCSQRDDIMSSASEKCLAPSSVPASGVPSTAVADTAILIDERISSTQMTRLCTLSSKLCDIALHRLLSREEIFAGNVLSGVQRFSRPLRYCILSPDQHSTLFQNIKKLMVLSESIARSLRGLCSCDNNRGIHGAKEIAIGDVYLSKLQLMSQAYSQYLEGMTSSWQVLRELRRCPDFLTFIQMRNDEKYEFNIETFLQQPFKHLQEMIAEFRFLAESFSGSVEDRMAFETVASTLLGLLQTPSAMKAAELNLISALNNPDDEEGYKRGNKDDRPRTKIFV